MGFSLLVELRNLRYRNRTGSGPLDRDHLASEHGEDCTWEPAWECFSMLGGSAAAIPPSLLGQLAETLRVVEWSELTERPRRRSQAASGRLVTQRCAASYGSTHESTIRRRGGAPA